MMTDDDKVAVARMDELRADYIHAVLEVTPEDAQPTECLAALASALASMIASTALICGTHLAEGIAIAKRGIDSVAREAYDNMQGPRH